MASSDNTEFSLVADIGGTNARFALADPVTGALEQVATLKVADYPTIEAAIRAYLDHNQSAQDQSTIMQSPSAACLAIACPVVGDQVNMTNHSWCFSRTKLLEQLGFERLDVINDYAAISYSISGLREDEQFHVGGGEAVAGFPQVIVGPGTGLGIGGVLHSEHGPIALEGEGGHVDFAPSNEQEIEVLKYLWRHHDHVPAEYLLSGMGLSNLHQALAEIAGQKTMRLQPAEISDAALLQGDGLCLDVLHCFCGILGSVAANTALTFGARGGVYIAGGIIPRMLPFFASSEFRTRFEAKGRYRQYMQAIPTDVITAEQPGLLGAAALLKR